MNYQILLQQIRTQHEGDQARQAGIELWECPYPDNDPAGRDIAWFIGWWLGPVKIITLPDGYNGHTRPFFAWPVAEDQACVKLHCADPGEEYLIKWVFKSDYAAALQAAERSKNHAS